MAEENQPDVFVVQPEDTSVEAMTASNQEAEFDHTSMEFGDDPNKVQQPFGKMSLIEHLQELRMRIIKSMVIVAIGFGISYFFADQLINFITAPAGKLYYMSPAEGFFSYMKVSLVSGLLLALPFLLYQIWAFIIPSLTKYERTTLVLLVPSSFALFIGGLAFSYFFVLPASLKFFMGFETENLQPLLSLGQYISFIISLLLPFGIIFELPLFLIVLGKAGLISSAFLRSKRKAVLVLSFVVGAVISPSPDVFSQTMIAVPLVVLYESSILILRYVMKK